MNNNNRFDVMDFVLTVMICFFLLWVLFFVVPVITSL